MQIRVIAFFLIFLPLFSCREKQGIRITASRPGKNEMADLNKYLVQKDKERIKNYIERKNLNMNESPTGLWFQIIKEGNARRIIIKNDKDNTIMEFPLTVGAIGVLLVPIYAAVGTLAALAMDYTIVVEKRDDTEKKD